MVNARLPNGISLRRVVETGRDLGYKAELDGGQIFVYGNSADFSADVAARLAHKENFDYELTLADGIYNISIERGSAVASFETEKPRSRNYNWGFTKAAAATGIILGSTLAGYALAEEFIPHLPDIVMDAAAFHVAGETHIYQDMASSIANFQAHGQNAISDASLTADEFPQLRSDISAVNNNLQTILQNFNGTGFNQTAKDIRGAMEELQSPPGGPIPIDALQKGIPAYQSLKTDLFPSVNQTLITWRVTNRGIENIGSQDFIWPDNSTFAGNEMSGLLVEIKEDYNWYREVERTQQTVTGISMLGIDDSHTDKPLKEYLPNLYENTQVIENWLNKGSMRAQSNQNQKFFSEFDGNFYSSLEREFNSAILRIANPDKKVPYSEPDLMGPIIDVVEFSGEVEAGNQWGAAIFAHDLGPANKMGVEYFDVSIEPPEDVATSLNVSNNLSAFYYTPEASGNYIFSIVPVDKSGNRGSPFNGNFSAWLDTTAPTISISDFRKTLLEKENQTVNFTVADDRTGILEVAVKYNESFYAPFTLNETNYYSIKFPVDSLGNKSAEIHVVDRRDNVASLKFNFSVKERPDETPPEILQYHGPEDGAILLANEKISAGINVRDNKGVARVEFVFDDTPYFGSNLVGDLWSVEIPSGQTAGAHRLSVRAYDDAGNFADQPLKTFTLKSPRVNPVVKENNYGWAPFALAGLGAAGAVGSGLAYSSRDGIRIDYVGVLVAPSGRIASARSRTFSQDRDVGASMLAAVGQFAKDSTGRELDEIGVEGGKKIKKVRGKDSYLLFEYSGENGKNVWKRARYVLGEIEESFDLNNWDGDTRNSDTFIGPWLDKFLNPTFGERMKYLFSKENNAPQGPSAQEQRLQAELAASQAQLAASEADRANLQRWVDYYNQELERQKTIASNPQASPEQRADAAAKATGFEEQLRKLLEKTSQAEIGTGETER